MMGSDCKLFVFLCLWISRRSINQQQKHWFELQMPSTWYVSSFVPLMPHSSSIIITITWSASCSSASSSSFGSLFIAIVSRGGTQPADIKSFTAQHTTGFAAPADYPTQRYGTTHDADDAPRLPAKVRACLLSQLDHSPCCGRCSARRCAHSPTRPNKRLHRPLCPPRHLVSVANRWTRVHLLMVLSSSWSLLLLCFFFFQFGL